MSMTAEIVSLDARAVQATIGVVSQAGPPDLLRPTPCGDWTLGDLLSHMIAQHDGFAAAAAGDGADPARWQGRPVAEPVAEYRAAAGRVLAAFGADGVLDREFALPEISPVRRFPAAQAISFHFVDYVVHGWDVARSLGLDYRLEPDLLAAALPVAQAVPDGEQRRAPGAAFAPGLAMCADTGTLGQIVAMLGRRPTWPA
jgi:uncharacterized protein (TIGR03086 family)